MVFVENLLALVNQNPPPAGGISWRIILADSSLTDWLGLCVNTAYTVATFWMLYVVRTQLLANERPYLIVGMEVQEKWGEVRLVFKNSGRSIAKNVKIFLDGPVIFKIPRGKLVGSQSQEVEFSEINIANIYPFNSDVGDLIPQCEIAIPLFSEMSMRYQEFFDNNKLDFCVRLEYFHGRKRYIESVVLHVEQVREAYVSLDPVASELREVNRLLSKIEHRLYRISR